MYFFIIENFVENWCFKREIWEINVDARAFIRVNTVCPWWLITYNNCHCLKSRHYLYYLDQSYSNIYMARWISVCIILAGERLLLCLILLFVRKLPKIQMTFKEINTSFLHANKVKVIISVIFSKLPNVVYRMFHAL